MGGGGNQRELSPTEEEQFAEDSHESSKQNYWGCHGRYQHYAG